MMKRTARHPAPPDAPPNRTTKPPFPPAVVAAAVGLLSLIFLWLQRRTSKLRNLQKSTAPCKLRIVHFNDVYEMDNLPVLRSAIDALAAEMAGQPNSTMITTFGGDFLAPSLLSSIDHGRAMVTALNSLPVDILCFGNHESDVPFEALLQRIEEFQGVWLNSNMTSLADDLPTTAALRCPPNHVVRLPGDAGRSVAFIGLLQGGGKDASLYREGAFNGHAARITPVLDAAAAAAAAAAASADTGGASADCVVPLTHQVLADDEALAAMGLGFPCILGGHDHDLIRVDAPSPDGVPGGAADEDEEAAEANAVATAASAASISAADNDNAAPATSIPILKAGEDAFNCIVVDLAWAAGAPPSPSPPTSLTHRVVRLGEPKNPKNRPSGNLRIKYSAHSKTAERIARLQSPAVELKNSVLARFLPGSLSSVGTRAGPSTMATMLASAMREAEGADVRTALEP